MKKNMKTLVCALVIMGIATVGTPIEFAKNVNFLIVEANAGEARAYIYEWAYKVMNGHVYKRLYNATLGEYVGDWILVE